MTEKKLNLIFDATLIAEAHKRNDGMRTGIYFAAVNILNALLKRKDVDISLYTKPEYAKSLQSFLSENGLSKTASYMPGVSLTKLTKAADAYYSPIFAVPNEIKHNPKIKKFITLYDIMPLLYPKLNPASAKGSWFMELMASLNIADSYFAISEYTKQELIKHLPYLNKNKITVTPLAADKIFCPQKDEETIRRVLAEYKIPSDKKYIFSLCTLEPRKNLLRTVKTFLEFINKHDINDLIFVLGGAHWKEFLPKLKKALNAKGGLKDKIRYIGYVKDKDLPSLYSAAEWFVYTSSYEGFGLPPLEAMACGCPVIASDSTSLLEVVGDAAQKIAYNSDEAHIKAYENYYFNQSYRKEMAEKGLKRAAKFSWDKTALVMAETMKKTLDIRKTTVPVVFISSKTYTIPTAAAISSLIANKAPATIYDIHIITNGVSKEDAKAFMRFDNKKDVRVTLHPYEASLKQYETKGYYVAGACILKFDISDMLPQYDKILYLDGDIIVREDLSSLYNLALKDNYAAAVGDFHGTVDLGFAERLKLKNILMPG